MCPNLIIIKLFNIDICLFYVYFFYRFTVFFMNTIILKWNFFFLLFLSFLFFFCTLIRLNILWLNIFYSGSFEMFDFKGLYIHRRHPIGHCLLKVIYYPWMRVLTHGNMQSLPTAETEKHQIIVEIYINVKCTVNLHYLTITYSD